MLLFLTKVQPFSLVDFEKAIERFANHFPIITWLIVAILVLNILQLLLYMIFPNRYYTYRAMSHIKKAEGAETMRNIQLQSIANAEEMRNIWH